MSNDNEADAGPIDSAIWGKPRVTPKQRLARIRERHHMLARTLQYGLPQGVAAELCGYTQSTASILMSDPLFQDLLVAYRRDPDTQARVISDVEQMARNAKKLALLAQRQMLDKFEEAEEAGEAIPLKECLAVFADSADRGGLPKKSTQLNINADFASMLDAAIRRTAEFEGATNAHNYTQPGVIDVTTESEPAGGRGSSPQADSVMEGPTDSGVESGPLGSGRATAGTNRDCGPGTDAAPLSPARIDGIDSPEMSGERRAPKKVLWRPSLVGCTEVQTPAGSDPGVATTAPADAQSSHSTPSSQGQHPDRSLPKEWFAGRNEPFDFL